MGYLVLFVADPAEDHHADALRDVARSVDGAGFFDGGETDAARTVGTYVRVGTLGEPGAQALVAAMGAFARSSRVRVEVQHDERVLGHLEIDGGPDQRLSDEFPRFGRS